jgi:hypothetical protein
MTTKITIEIDPDATKPTIAARDVELLSGGAPVPSYQLVSVDDTTIIGNSGVTPLSVAVPCIAAARIASTGVISSGVGVASVVHFGTGTYVVTLSSPSAGLVAFVTCHTGFGAPGVTQNSDNTITVSTVNTSNVATDAAFHLLVVRP